MGDYYPAISEAIADKTMSESRRVFYDRARATLIDRLRKADPPLSERFIELERLDLEDAINKAEAVARPSEETWLTADGLQTQSDHAEEHIRSAALEASWAQLNAKVQIRRERRAFWGFLIMAVIVLIPTILVVAVLASVVLRFIFG